MRIGNSVRPSEAAALVRERSGKKVGVAVVRKLEADLDRLTGKKRREGP